MTNNTTIDAGIRMSTTDNNMMKLCKQMEQVRLSGETNMWDRNAVQVIAHRLELHELVVWIEQNNSEEYGHLLQKFKDIIPDGYTEQVQRQRKLQ